jgi:hypothetical protein
LKITAGRSPHEEFFAAGEKCTVSSAEAAEEKGITEEETKAGGGLKGL